MEGWTCILIESQAFRADLMKNALEGAGIPALVLNQRDSSYGFGELRVMVPSKEADRARVVLGLAPEQS